MKYYCSMNAHKKHAIIWVVLGWKNARPKTLELRAIKIALAKQNQLMRHSWRFGTFTLHFVCVTCLHLLSTNVNNYAVKQLVIWLAISEMEVPHNQFTHYYTFLPLGMYILMNKQNFINHILGRVTCICSVSEQNYTCMWLINATPGQWKSRGEVTVQLPKFRNPFCLVDDFWQSYFTINLSTRRTKTKGWASTQH